MRAVGRARLPLAPLALVLSVAACASEDAVGTVRDDDARPDFDGQRAYQLVEQQVAFGPRVPGRPGHAAQLEWMLELLDERADSVVTQSFVHTARDGNQLPLTNVRAVFLPAEPDPSVRPILLLAHWDTRPISDGWAWEGPLDTPVPGANDGGSGVAVLLELSRLLAEEPPPVPVHLLFVDGEDYGPGDMYLGSYWFAATMAEDYDPRYGVLLDMVGDAEPRFPVEGHSADYAPDVVQRVWGVAAELGYGEYFPLEEGPTLGDDHVPLNEAGIPTVDVIDFTYGGPDNPLWHTPDDVPANVSAATLEIVGEVVTELVYRPEGG